ncbi:HIRAN domain-containing protein [Bacillus mycoides]|uniref:HIRAN domain-containing protein n=1 Tax=Bacillus mycoides TaxID=1405 RepID=UPI003D066E38
MVKSVLWLIWQNIETRQRYHIGNLYHDQTGYYFEYEKSKKHRGLQEALEQGYCLHLAFPDLKKTYYSSFLFSAFSRRLPSTGRPDFNELLKHYGLSNDYTEMDLLRVTNGRLGTDSYEMVAPIFIDDNRFGFDFFVAGWRHYEGEALLETLSSATLVCLKREPENKQDSFAVRVDTESGNSLGYVPAFYSEFVAEVLDKGCTYKLQIDKIDAGAIPQLRMNILVEGYLDHNVDKNVLLNFLPIQEGFEVKVCIN